MASLSLRVHIVKTNNVKTMQFDPDMIVHDICKDIRDRLGEANTGGTDHGLFWPDEDPKKGRWLEPGRTLNYYDLKSGDMLEYKKKHRPLRVRLMDGTLKTVLVDDSQSVGDLVKTVCSRIGINNPDEFAFVSEAEVKEEEKKPRDRDEEEELARSKKDREKMEKLKKKLHTDDEIGWLLNDRSLREQGIDETQVLLLRKKFFFSDQNVDRNDPVQLNLLYVQSRDAILNGTHPCTEEEACQFAAMQCQVQFGDHQPDKHKPGFFDIKGLLPPEYAKNKSVEKRIFQEHAKLHSMTELNAKYRYIQLCRSLKTYGVTFFLVKEKERGKNKLVPRLLGITRDNIMRVDEKTKEVLKTWQLTQVRRWAASPNSFTLDFGDYSESYYSVQTSEGDAISQLIAGYIDIILKKKKNSDRGVGEDGEEQLMLEDSVSAGKATAIQHVPSALGYATEGSVALPGIVRSAGAGVGQFGRAGAQQLRYSSYNGSGMSATGQQAHMGMSMADASGHGAAQHALMGTVQTGFAAVNAATNELGVAASLPPLGTDPASIQWRQQTLDVSKQNMASQLAAMTAATASVVTLTGAEPSEVDHTAVGSAVTTISSNLTELAKNAKMMAALVSDSGTSDRLLEAARGLAGATSKLLNSVKPGSTDSRQDLLTAASAIGAATSDLLAHMGEPEVDAASQEELLAISKAIAAATTNLVSSAKTVASKSDDPAAQNKVINAAKGTAMSTSQLVACTKVLAPSINSPMCQEQLIESAKQVTNSVDSLVGSADSACKDEAAKAELKQNAATVSEAVQRLIAQAQQGGRAKPQNDFDEACDTILASTEKLFASMGNAPEMVRQAKALAQATSQLVNCIKADAAKETDPEKQRKLLAAAKELAECTARMIAAAKEAAQNPNDATYQAKLKEAAEALRTATNAAAAAAIKKKLMKKLEEAAKQTAAASTQLIAASQASTSSNRNQASQQQLLAQCKAVQDTLGQVISATRDHANNPDTPSAQLNLINATKAVVNPGVKMVAAAKAAHPTVGDPAAALNLANAAKQAALALAELRSAQAKAADACGSLEIDSAMHSVNQLGKDLQDAQKAAAEGKLLPLPGDNAEEAALEVGATSKTVGSSMAQLLTAANQGNENYTGIAARDTAGALKVLASAVRGVAATTNDREAQDAILKSAHTVMAESAKLIGEANAAVKNSADPQKQQKLAAVAKTVSAALNQVVSCLPGQRDVDNCIRAIAAASERLDSGNFPAPKPGETFAQSQDALTNAAAALNLASNDLVVAARGTPQQLAEAAKAYQVKHQNFIDSGVKLAGATKDVQAQQELISQLKGVSASSSRLVIASKALAADPSGPNNKNNLALSARGVTDAINALLDTCSTSAPGQKECDNAIRNINAMAASLNNPSEPVSDASYFECLDTVLEKSKVLANAMGEIANSARSGEGEKIGASVTEAASAVTALTEAAAQAAYLVGVADPSSSAAVVGLVDQGQFARAQQAIQGACDSLLVPNASQQQILSAATVIAKHTAALCTACKTASTKTANPPSRHIIKAPRHYPRTTKTRSKCAQTTKPLLAAVDNMVTYASSPEFASQAAVISAHAKAAQQPLVNAGKGLVSSSTNLIGTAKSLAGNPKDPPSWQVLAANSKSVTDSIKNIVNAIRDHAPGQHECDEAIQEASRQINHIDQAALAAAVGGLERRNDQSLGAFQQNVLSELNEITELLPKLQQSAKAEPENLAHEVLDQTKTVAESALNLLYAAKESGGNIKASNSHPKVDSGVAELRDVMKDLNHTFEESANSETAAQNIVAAIHKAVADVDRLDQPGALKDFVATGSFNDYSNALVEESKTLAKTAAKSVAFSTANPSELLRVARDISAHYNNIGEQAKGVVATAPNAETQKMLKAAVMELGPATAALAQSCAVVQSSPDNADSRKELNDNARLVSEKVGKVMAAVKSSAKGTAACETAINNVQGIVGDLQTMAMFAASGSLNPDDPKDNFNAHKEDILKRAKEIVENTKALVTGAASSQEALATAAKSSVDTLSHLSDACKRGATSISSRDSNAQELLLNAVKDVAAALADLIGSTKTAAGRSVNDPAMEGLKENAKGMVNNISQLVKVVKSVEDEASRGVRALESAIEAIGTELKVLESPEAPKRDASPEELVAATKMVTTSTAKIVSAANSNRQEEVVAAANMARKALTDLMQYGKGAAAKADTPDKQARVTVAVRDAANNAKAMLEAVYNALGHPTADAKNDVTNRSKKVAAAVADVVDAAKLLKGDDYVDPEDPNVIAENELLAAAAAIEAAARKLADLKPRETPRAANEDLNFEEQILEAAKAIATATSALVKAAGAAQKELVSTGKIDFTKGTAKYHENAMWSEGLVSAAKGVAAATGSLCDAANTAVQGEASQERLVSSAKQVASSTAQLVVACRVKADANSKTQSRLNQAASMVKSATDELVKSASEAAVFNQPDANITVDQRFVGSIAQVIAAQELILKQERELEKARKQLADIRKGQYQNK
ncbi:hypothetical protein CAOG_009384 [Capsaspora owczarzaki ATCC 30864]|uniref:Talin-1 n=1 Tax=Capsaspora owczarzaki (strain ATCC 30864) TaxID=595528 RepID=A0A0D2WIK7_CAPO3|nr:hypothetical protein CAOG_009384 [Capsaspora owczarzaki ATCC 30864]